LQFEGLQRLYFPLLFQVGIPQVVKLSFELKIKHLMYYVVMLRGEQAEDVFDFLLALVSEHPEPRQIDALRRVLFRGFPKALVIFVQDGRAVRLLGGSNTKLLLNDGPGRNKRGNRISRPLLVGLVKSGFRPHQFLQLCRSVFFLVGPSQPVP
jgi:hypothetical protein